MKTLVAVVLCVNLLPISTVSGADWKARLFRVSQAIYIGANVADVGSSVGSWEANPLLRSAGGRFEGRGIAIKGAMFGGILATQWVCHRKMGRRVELPFAAANLGHSAVMAAIVKNNIRIRAGRN